ncbi:maleylpyruvate isomerase N-terminal domain-containing protein [Streptomyces lasalocidi]
MTQVRELYLSVAESAGRLLAEPAVADGWHQPSALAKLSVRGLAGHLAGQVFFIPAVLAEPVPSEPAISIHEYYRRVSWIGSDIDTPFNQGIRSGGEDEAADGPAALAARVAKCVDELRGTLLGRAGSTRPPPDLGTVVDQPRRLRHQPDPGAHRPLRRPRVQRRAAHTCVPGPGR